MKSSAVAYVLWLLCLVGICGVHRLYAGRVVSGVLWLLTFGLLGFGQLIDLVLIPGMIDHANLRFAAFAGLHNKNTNIVNVHVAGPSTASITTPTR